MNPEAPLSAWADLGRVPALILLLLVGFALYLPGFATLPPVDRDESHFAQASKQMLETGNFVDIRMQEATRYNKPIGIYWLQSAAVSLMGRPLDDIWPYRLPSLVGALLALVFLVRIGGRLFDRRVGLIAALLLGASLLLGVEARLAKTDATLLATSMAAFDGLVAAYLGQAKRANALQFWVALSLGILVKGPVLPFFLLTTAGTVSLVQRRWRWLGALEFRLGLPLLVLIVAPWLVAIGIASHGAFFSQSLGHDFGAKLVGGEESHGFPPGFYLAAMTITFWPGGLLFAAALPSVWRQRRETAIRFLLCWLIPAWLVLEIVPTKLPHYVLPLYPAVALLAAAVFADVGKPLGAGWPRWLLQAGMAAWFATGLALAGAVAALGWRLAGRLDAVALATLLLVGAAMALALLAFVRGVRNAGLAGLLAASFLLQAGGFGFALPSLDRLWVSRSAARLVAETSPCPRPVTAVAGDFEPSLVFLLGTETKPLDGPGAARYLLAAQGKSCALALVSVEDDNAFRDALQGAAPKDLGLVEGIDYSTGKNQRMTLYGLP
ncbi:MAG TPA: glycosyltransferase family 39 protein [Candidatus Udaeobacter sp.]|nr:glycosyltransferase family 39 protein [Candidatus Udaeobacter sp.]